MQTYLVGGAVRDGLLGRRVTERDWVVVGATEEVMRELGYRQVGRDFPVFLHPDTGEEYALARTERKTGAGHTGFECHAGIDVTLEEDLQRRDLTINAIAEDAKGNLVDPYGGRADIEGRRLRHVSDAFREDPLRVFRVARFAAMLPDFEVVPETIEIMRTMSDELGELSAERVWRETERASMQPAPWRFFAIVLAADASVPWFEGMHLEALQKLIQGRRLEGDAVLAGVGWLHDPNDTITHFMRLKAPRRISRVAAAVSRFGRVLADFEVQEPRDVLAALEGIGAFQTGDVAALALQVIERCSDSPLERLRDALRELVTLRLDAANAKSAEGAAYGEALRCARLERLAGKLQ